jgi:hypothetical protein
VPSFGPKMVWTKCGTIGADVRLNWMEKGKQVAWLEERFGFKRIA